MNHLLVDGNYLTTYLWFRQRSGGQGFWLEMLNIADHFETNHIAVAFDWDGAKKRKEIYADYKGSRDTIINPIFEEWRKVRTQVYAGIMDSMEVLPISCGSVEGLEADDLLWHWSQIVPSNDNVVILTGDKDLYQCCFQKDNVRIYHPKDGSVIDREKVRTEFSSVEGMILQKAIVGDNSDNIKGVKGIGFKRAKALWDSVDNLYDLLTDNSITALDDDTLKKHKYLPKAFEERDIIQRNLKLIRLGDMFDDDLKNQSESIFSTIRLYNLNTVRHYAAAMGWQIIIQKWDQINTLLGQLNSL